MVYRLLLILLFPFIAHGQILVNGWKQGGSSPTLPTANLWAYYEADQGVTGSPVSQWNDLSGNARHLTQGTSANRPTYNGTNTITFAYSTNSQHLFRTSTPTVPYTVYVVGTIVTNSNYTIITCDANSGSINHSMFGDGSQFRLTSNNGSNQIGTTLPANNTLVLMRGVFNGASSTVQINNAAAGTGNIGATAPNNFFMLGYDFGTGFAGNFTVRAVYIYQGAVTDADVKAYTSWKWGVP